MTDAEGTYSHLAELADKHASGVQRRTKTGRPRKDTADASNDSITTTPYVGQNFRFTEDELRWLRQQAYALTEKLDLKVTQTLILRVAIHALRDAYEKNRADNPLLDALSRLKQGPQT